MNQAEKADYEYRCAEYEHEYETMPAAQPFYFGQAPCCYSASRLYTPAMVDRKALFMYSPELESLPYPEDHPFNTRRARRTRELAESRGWLSGPGIQVEAAEPAGRMDLKKMHSARYLHAFKRSAEGVWQSEAMGMGLGSSDCPMFEGVFDHAVLATGMTLCAARKLLAGEVDVAFNPSGGFHHAGPEQASGFCYINDVAIACLTLADAGKRVIYLDIDVHHGDGVAYAVYERADVMTISLHEDPRVLFPGTGFVHEIGKDAGEGYCVNVPLPIGTYDMVYQNAFEALVLPLIKAYGPDVFVLEFGADALAGDPLAHLQLTNNTYVEVITQLLAFGKPILMTGGGGYQIENTVRAWALGWRVLCGTADEAAGPVPWEALLDEEVEISDLQRETVSRTVSQTVEQVKKKVFPYHGIS